MKFLRTAGALIVGVVGVSFVCVSVRVRVRTQNKEFIPRQGDFGGVYEGWWRVFVSGVFCGVCVLARAGTVARTHTPKKTPETKTRRQPS